MIQELLYTINVLQARELEVWLKKEYTKSSEGFYCNWNTIVRAINQNNLWCLTQNKKIVAFLVWHSFDTLHAKIDIVEVKPTMRKKGVGKGFVELALIEFAKRGVMIVDLECEPPTSECFWKSCKFSELPEGFSQGATRLFRPLVHDSQGLPPTSDLSHEIIELWHKDNQLIKNDNPDCLFKISYNPSSRDLLTPIIQPCMQDWKIRWRKGNNVYFDDRAKRFLNTHDNMLYGDFLIIQALPIPSFKK